MNNRWLLMLLLLFFAGTMQAAQTQVPNIVYLLMDDMGWGDVETNNARSKIPTPNLNRLASEGMVFTDAHAGSSVCTPSRYATMTGRYSWRGSLKRGIIWGYAPPLIEKGRMTLASLLKARGYATACFGKWHLGMGMPTTDGKAPNHIGNPTNIDWAGKISPSVLDFGFDHYYGTAGSAGMPPFVMIGDDRFLGKGTIPKYNNGGGVSGWKDPNFIDDQLLPQVFNRACAYIRSRKNNPQPFFVYLPSPAPHSPCLPLEKYKGRTNLGAYGDYCVEQDDLIGDVMRAIDEAGCRENTLVIFASDNGFWKKLNPKKLEAKGHYPSGPYRGYKAEVYEGGHRSPFFVRWPAKIKAGTVSHVPICQTDLMATFAELLGVKLPDDSAEDSASFLPILLGKSDARSVHDYLIHQSADGSLAIRQGRWKLARCPGIGSSPKKKKRLAQLFDMANDPYEKKNVAAEHPEIVARLLQTLRQSVETGRSVPRRKPSAVAE